MSTTLLIIVVFAAIVLMMVVQTNLSKLKSPAWGAIIPTVVFIAAIYAHFIVKVELRFGSILIFLIPFIWSLEEWYRGRKKRLVETEKEITKMKAKDI